MACTLASCICQAPAAREPATPLFTQPESVSRSSVLIVYDVFIFAHGRAPMLPSSPWSIWTFPATLVTLI